VGLHGENIEVRIPDEGQRHSEEVYIEDRAGYLFCPHCINCTLNKYDTIYSDGGWYCLAGKEWRRGDDCIEFDCAGYKPKTCETCKHYKSCKLKRDYEGCWCNKYALKGLTYPENFYYGRRKKISKRATEYVIELEERYISGKRANYQRKRAEENREYQQEQARNEQLGHIQIPDPDEEG
jgi:hypothetical protein